MSSDVPQYHGPFGGGAVDFPAPKAGFEEARRYLAEIEAWLYGNFPAVEPDLDHRMHVHWAPVDPPRP